MKINLFIILMVATTLFFSCDSDTSTGPSEDMLVVRGFLYANEPVWDIQITQTLELGSADSTAPPINNAQVVLLKNETVYELVASDGDSGYYHYDGQDLNIESGDEFEIQVINGEQSASGQTTVPTPPSGLALDKNTITVMSFTGGFPGQGGFDRESLELNVTWDEDSDALFYVVVENLELNPVEIETGFKGGNGNRRFVFPPTNRNQYRINAMSLTHLGKHAVRVYRVNQEYADLYGTREQDSRELNEPLTNITGGLGVFSAFNSISAEFQVTTE
jgi:hypothetical protein